MGEKFGQHFLADQNILRKIITLTAPKSSDVVVEVGCGEGVLTQALAERAGFLYVVEIDPLCVAKTQTALAMQMADKTLLLDKVMFLQADVLASGFPVPVSQCPFRVIANLPYYISAKFIGLCAENKAHISDITLMLQLEFAKKLLAKPGDAGYTPLAIFSQMHFTMAIAFPVGRRCFRPAPKVDSAIVTFIPKPLPEDVDMHFFTFIKAVFWGRRKPLLSALRKNPYWRLVETDLSVLDIYHNVRAETLSLAELRVCYHRVLPFLG